MSAPLSIEGWALDNAKQSSASGSVKPPTFAREQPRVVVGTPTARSTGSLQTTAVQVDGPLALAAESGIRWTDNVARLPPPTPPSYTFDVRQQWEGVVTNVDRDEFTVVLRDIAAPDAPEFEAVLPLDEVSPDDLRLLRSGSVLYWTIGYEQTTTGQRKRVSAIRLRRLPAWSRADVARVERRAKELSDLFEAG